MKKISVAAIAAVLFGMSVAAFGETNAPATKASSRVTGGVSVSAINKRFLMTGIQQGPGEILVHKASLGLDTSYGTVGVYEETGLDADTTYEHDTAATYGKTAGPVKVGAAFIHKEYPTPAATNNPVLDVAEVTVKYDDPRLPIVPYALGWYLLKDGDNEDGLLFQPGVATRPIPFSVLGQPFTASADLRAVYLDDFLRQDGWSHATASAALATKVLGLDVTARAARQYGFGEDPKGNDKATENVFSLQVGKTF